MRRFDVCNGDADGLCATVQWRLAFPAPAELVTGLKRDIALLQQVPASAGDEVLVCDLSMQRNRAALLELLKRGVSVRCFDHHKADDLPRHPGLDATIDFDRHVCTSLLVDRHLGGRFRAWALVGAYGDNLGAVADPLADGLGLDDADRAALRALGEAINYNAYGESPQDQHIAPQRLYELMLRHPHPLGMLRHESICGELVELRRTDLQRALGAQRREAGNARMCLLPDEPWSRRVIGSLANELSSAEPQRAHAVLKADRRGGYVVSLRAPQTAPGGADEFCRRFGGGGRAGAAGIDHLPHAGLEAFESALAGTRWGEAGGAPHGSSAMAEPHPPETGGRSPADTMAGPAHDGPSLAAQAQAVAVLRERLGAELIETHISWVLVAGGQAYKIKKAVDLGFLDFRSLASRRFFCEEELRLNRRTAPALYLEVLPLTGSAENPAIGGSGEPIDWVLHMRAFAQHDLWDRLASRGALRGSHIDQGVAALCSLHDGAAVAAADDPRGRSDRVRAPLLDSLAVLPGLCSAPADRAVVDELRAWEAQAHVDLDPVFDRRLSEGRVRECHGDLHLGNVTLLDGRTLLFDCLEFDAALRWTDVFSDVAFLAMDLQAHRLPRLAHRFVNGYVERSGDHDGLRVLRWYQVHRALVRAKVAALRAGQLGHDASRQASVALHHYLEVARVCSRPATPVLLLTHGCSGSGKTLATQSLLELLGAIRIRADVERKRLLGLEPLQRAPAAAYGDSANEATQTRLRTLAAKVLRCGIPVILDATFADAADRDAAHRLAAECGASFVIIAFQAQADTLRRRVQQRAARDDDASDAGLEVLEQQLARALPLRTCEPVWPFDAEPEHDEAAMPARWAPLLERLAAATAAGLLPP